MRNKKIFKIALLAFIILWCYKIPILTHPQGSMKSNKKGNGELVGNWIQEGMNLGA